MRLTPSWSIFPEPVGSGRRTERKPGGCGENTPLPSPVSHPVGFYFPLDLLVFKDTVYMIQTYWVSVQN